jgi:hypothetical protein
MLHNSAVFAFLEELAMPISHPNLSTPEKKNTDKALLEKAGIPMIPVLITRSLIGANTLLMWLSALCIV